MLNFKMRDAGASFVFVNAKGKVNKLSGGALRRAWLSLIARGWGCYVVRCTCWAVAALSCERSGFGGWRWKVWVDRDGARQQRLQENF